MTTTGISAIASYIPPGRVAAGEITKHWPSGGRAQGITTASVAGYDEDPITMAVEACLRVLDSGGTTAASVDALIMATCSGPYAEHSLAAEIAKPLGLPRSAALADLAGSTRGGVQAVRLAYAMVRSGEAERVLVVAGESRQGELGTPLEQSLAAGAVAVLVESGDAVVLAIEDWTAWRGGVPTRWRSNGETMTRWFEDVRFERTFGIIEPVATAVDALLDRVDVGRADVTFLASGYPDGGLARPLAKALKLDKDADLTDEVPKELGDLGAAGALHALGVAARRAAVGASGLLVGFEPGSGADATLVRVVAALPPSRALPDPTEIGYIELLQRRAVLRGPGGIEPAVAWPATPSALRDDPFTTELVGGECDACQSLNFPPRLICIDCGERSFHPMPLPMTGRVVTYNAQHVVAVAPEPVPVVVGVVRLDGAGGERGGQVSAMFTDTPPDRIVVDSPVELVYRRVGVEYGLVKYGWKFRATEETS